MFRRGSRPTKIQRPGGRERRSLLPLIFTVLGLAALAPASRAEVVKELAVWADGPVRWLILSSEQKRLRRMNTTSEAIAFIESFWARRDPEPDEPGNPYREIFSQRVEAADVLYAEESARGSLTDRGRALILMGPPTNVTVSSEPALAWDPSSGKNSRVTMRRVDVEVWGYRLEDLPDGLLELWLKKKRASEDALALTLSFRTVGRRTTLVEGEALLETAAQASVRSSKP